MFLIISSVVRRLGAIEVVVILLLWMWIFIYLQLQHVVLSNFQKFDHSFLVVSSHGVPHVGGNVLSLLVIVTISQVVSLSRWVIRVRKAPI